MKPLLAIGLMSGTSLDGIDAVLVKIDENESFEIIASTSGSYTEHEREKIFKICDVETSNVAEICSMNMYLGDKFASVVHDLLKKSGYESEDIAFISSHGQTIYHIPKKDKENGYIPSTLQIGDVSILSERTNIAVVGDFRTADMAADGQGAPLTSFVDYFLFQSDDKTRVVQNIGGIGNVTYLPKGRNAREVQSFDTGPGNMIIDEVVLRVTNGKQTYDENGDMARSGTVDQKLLAHLMQTSYLYEAPPKTTGRELFGKSFVDEICTQYGHVKGHDLVATVTEFTVQTIAYHYRTYLENDDMKIDEIIIGGGGTYNTFLMERLQQLFPNAAVYGHEHFYISSDFKEALAFVVLGHAFLKGKYNTLPSATGASHPVIMGKLSATQPQAWKRVLDVSSK